MGLNRDDERAGAIFRLLETDFLLGIRHAPLRMAARPGVAPSNAARQPASRSAAGGSARPAAPARPGTPASRVSPGPAPAAAPAPASTGPIPENEGRVVRLDMPKADFTRRSEQLKKLNDAGVSKCRKCHLCETRTRTVFGQGEARTRLVFVGEAPGFDEDQQGLAFVGRAGQLLTKMIEAMGIKREWVFICNILKCRPPDNRTPAPDEIQACWPYLDEQLRTIQPDVIVALGKPASQTLLRTDESIGRLRGQWHQYYASGTPGVGEPTALMPTYHPAYLLRNPADKSKAWSDLKQVMERLGLPLPSGG
jgi:DNA polymerase